MIPQVIFRFALFLCGLLISTLIPFSGKLLIPRALGFFDARDSVILTHWFLPIFCGVALFTGIVYAHILCRRFSIRSQTQIHLFVLSISVFLLFVFDPYEAIMNWTGPSQRFPFMSLFLFIIRVWGPVFVVISSSTVLLQYWYSRIGGSQAADPYFLYGTFNFGSLTGLFLYPLYIEWLYPLHTQSTIWKICFAMLVVLVAVCIWWTVRDTQESTGDSEPVGAWRRIRWISFAAAPIAMGSVLYAIRPGEMQWATGVVMLAVIRLSLVFTFVRQSISWTAYAIGFVVCLSPFAVYFWMFRNRPNSIALIAIATAFFFFSFVCYRALYRARPSAARLTEFYLYLAIGRLGEL